ncbi:LysR family transcriptional regulator [Thalassotalea fonticola]|uniref:LysR family transcriptional regulator n=1 Tax=Thalassotalea fonticola TaxID=3065649 RepID=A0ABZ0GIS8_9GAMM|nr:LysR family transcriptional regulator [Colwelliaceae bacterium S1-1]
MKIQWIQDFLSLVDTGSFSKSADIRATTQPAFSRRIKALEEWLCTTLFDRSESPVCLTDSGGKFLPIANETLDRLYQCKDEMARENLNSVNIISFAATHTLSSNFFPRWLNNIEQTLGILRTRLESDHYDKGKQSLIKGQCHFMLCHTHPNIEINLNQQHYNSVVVGKDRLIPVCAPAQNNSPSMLLPGSIEQPIKYLGYNASSGVGKVVKHLLLKNHDGIYLDLVFESYLVGVLKQMCCEGRGIAWLPEQQIVDELSSSKLVKAYADNPENELRWSIDIDIKLFRAREALPESAEQLWHYALENSVS